MNQLEDIMKEFGFSEEMKEYVKDSSDYESYASVSDDVIVEIEQQRVVSSNNFFVTT